MRMGLREANQHFAKAMRRVRAGHEVVLTDRGRPFAVIRPLPQPDDEEARLQAMADEGLIELPSKPGPMPTPRWKPISISGKPLSQTIIEDRDEDL